METLLQLVLIRLLILLDELTISLESVSTLLQQLFETQPEFVLVFGGNLAFKQVSEEDSGNLNWTLIDCCADTTLELHLQYLGIIPLHGSIQLGNLHLDVLDGHLYWSQDNLLLLGHLDPGLDVGEVVDGGEDGLPLVLISQVSVR